MNSLTDNEYICRLIGEGEHQKQDFKFEISDTRKIARTLSAFANTEGGRLLIGVKDNGKIAGIKTEEESYMIEAAARLYCVPEVKFSLQSFRCGNRTVLMVTIDESKFKPVFAKDVSGKMLAYVRIHDENVLATPVHLKVWKQSLAPTGELVSFTENERLLLDLIEDNSLFSINKYCRSTGLTRRSAQHLLAKLIRFGIIEMIYQNRRFCFRLRK